MEISDDALPVLNASGDDRAVSPLKVHVVEANAKAGRELRVGFEPSVEVCLSGGEVQGGGLQNAKRPEPSRRGTIPASALVRLSC